MNASRLDTQEFYTKDEAKADSCARITVVSLYISHSRNRSDDIALLEERNKQASASGMILVAGGFEWTGT